jgi:hypothetical protein
MGNILENIIADIKKSREKVRADQGSYKYDGCYEDCIKIVRRYRKEAEKLEEDIRDDQRVEDEKSFERCLDADV